MLHAFRRMAQGVLSALGEDAFFDGSTTPTKINIENGVQVQDENNQSFVVERDVATILSDVNPKAGKTFVQNGRTYKLQYRVQDSGVAKRFVVMDITV